jgi:hypothetical protein
LLTGVTITTVVLLVIQTARLRPLKNIRDEYVKATLSLDSLANRNEEIFIHYDSLLHELDHANLILLQTSSELNQLLSTNDKITYEVNVRLKEILDNIDTTKRTNTDEIFLLK